MRFARPLLITAAIGAAVTVTPIVGTAHAAAPAFCGATGFDDAHTFVWTGAAHDGRWGTAANWNHNAIPGGRVDLEGSHVQPQLVCIGENADSTPATVSLLGGATGESAHIESLDLGQGATLDLTVGAQIYLGSDDEHRTSYVRNGSTFILDGATLGGHGELQVSGTFDWLHNAAGVATFTTRECDVGGTCSPTRLDPSSTVGTTIVEADGQMVVGGGGVNLEDDRQLIDYGQVDVAGDSYISADHGTSIDDNKGTFTFGSNSGIYEGRNHGDQPPPTFYDAGSIIKHGTGSAIISIFFATGNNATATVKAGLLSAASPLLAAAKVAQGGEYGIGGCQVASTQGSCSAPTPTQGQKQIGSVALPAGFNGSGTVTLSKTGAAGAHGRVGGIFNVSTKGVTSSPTHPELFRFTYDTSLLNGKRLKDLTVQAKTLHKFVAVPKCLSNGKPPKHQLTCVDRRKKATASQNLPGGDVLVVVRGQLNGNSRWVVR